MFQSLKNGSWARLRLTLLMVAVGAVSRGCGENVPTLSAEPARTTGTVVYVLLDVSGSMSDPVTNATGNSEAKLSIAKRAAIDVCKAVAKYAAEDKTRHLEIALATFSNDFQVTTAMGEPNVEKAELAINQLAARGGTAIGNAVIEAQKALDRTRLKSQHILIITDGENNLGLSPTGAADALNALPEALRPAVYVVAFDVNAKVFDGVKNKGWQVFSAANGKELTQRLDEVVGGHILVEQYSDH
jgi:Mg-chelatase subunit ChlD